MAQNDFFQNDLDKIFRVFVAEEKHLDSTDRENLFKRIKSSLENIEYSRKRKRIAFTVISSAAAILLAFVFFNHRTGDEEFNYESVCHYLPDESGNVRLCRHDEIIEVTSSPSIIYEADGFVVNGSNYPITDRNEIHQIIVPYGQTADLTLADGTSIKINSGSKVIFKAGMTGRKREIFVSGETFLDVSHNPARPFTVKTDRIDVSVLGTKFDVKAYSYEDTRSVVLVEGSVLLNGDLLDKSYKLTPEQKFSYNSLNCEVGIEQVDVSDYTCWMDGLMKFSHACLKDVLIQLYRYYNVSISFDPSLKDITISGKLDLKEGLESILQSVTLTSGTSYIKKDGTYFIMKK